MDSFNWLIAEMLINERQREATMLSRAAPERPASRGGVKHALATTFVRLGLRLDPAAGEGLGAPLARREHLEQPRTPQTIEEVTNDAYRTQLHRAADPVQA